MSNYDLSNIMKILNLFLEKFGHCYNFLKKHYIDEDTMIIRTTTKKLNQNWTTQVIMEDRGPS